MRAPTCRWSRAPGITDAAGVETVASSLDAAIARVLESFEADRQARIALLHRAIREARRFRQPSKAAGKPAARPRIVLDRSSKTLVERLAELAALRLVARGDRSPAVLRATGLPALVLAADLLTSANAVGARGDVRSTASRTTPVTGLPQGEPFAPETTSDPSGASKRVPEAPGETAKLRVLERLRSKPRPQLPASKGVR